MAKSAYAVYYYGYIGFALAVAVYYLYLTLGGYIPPSVSIGGSSFNVAEVVAAVLAAATVFLIYVRHLEEGRREAEERAAPARPAKAGRRGGKKARR